MKRRTFLNGLAAATAAPVILRSLPARAATMQAYTYLNVAAKPGVVGLQDIADAIKTASDGKYSFQVNLAGTLGIKPSDTTQALSDGLIQLADNQYYLGLVPIAGLLRLPALIDGPEDYDKAYAIMKPVLDKAFKKQGVKVIGYYLYPPQVIFGTGHIGSLADLKGLKIRVTSAEQGKFVQTFGGSPVTMPSAELAAGLQRHVIDGCITASAGGARTLGELLKSNYRLNTSTIDSFYMVSSAFYEQLDDATRKAVDDSGAAAGKKATEMLAKEEPEWVEKLKKEGVEPIAPKPEDQKLAFEKMQPYWEEWAKKAGGEAPELLAKIRKALGK